MAKVKMYAAKDKRIGIWTAPMFYLHPGQCERQVREFLSDPRYGDMNIAKYPADHVVYLIGEYDDSTGEVVGLEKPQHFLNVEQLKESPQEDLPLMAKKPERLRPRVQV